MQVWKSFSHGVLLVVAGLGLMVVSGCETNPYTGRSQLLMTSVSEEMKMGAQAYSQGARSTLKWRSSSSGSDDHQG